MCAPDGRTCPVEQALRDRIAHLEAREADLLAEIALLKGLTRLPGAVEAAHRNTRAE